MDEGIITDASDIDIVDAIVTIEHPEESNPEEKLILSELSR